ncbi:MAG: 50S ribosomal protein L3 [Parcubacteria group bacterium GW2011_GWC2_32_10]|nr:MAG: 50S ribosomal protein L3 [Parcubacteria group bacterium GW2011_GWC2_32_10]
MMPSFHFRKNMKFILGKKVVMSQLFDKNGKLTPVTLIASEPCIVLQKKVPEKDGYSAIQFGQEKIEKKNKIKKSMKGKEFKSVRENRIKSGEANGDEINVGDKIDVSVFTEGDSVKVSGISKGKGFQGGVKRHGFHGRNASHGVKHEQRTIGSTGCRFPQHVIKGRKMPGRMGSDRVTVQNLKIMKVDLDNNLLVVKGAVPGRDGTLLEVRG